MKRTIGALSIILAVVFSVGAMWWWALFGMTPEVGMACAATAALGVVGVFAIYMP